MAQAYAIVVPVRPRRAAHHISADMALAADRAGPSSSIRIEVGRLERGGELQRNPVGVLERQHGDAERRQVGDGAVLHATLLEGPGRGLQLSPAGHREAQVVKAAAEGPKRAMARSVSTGRSPRSRSPLTMTMPSCSRSVARSWWGSSAGGGVSRPLGNPRSWV